MTAGRVPRDKSAKVMTRPNLSLQNRSVSVMSKVKAVQRCVGISDYEKLRLRSIENNRAMMIKLGLLSPEVNERKVKKKKEKSLVNPELLRRSIRLSSKHDN